MAGPWEVRGRTGASSWFLGQSSPRYLGSITTRNPPVSFVLGSYSHEFAASYSLAPQLWINSSWVLQSPSGKQGFSPRVLGFSLLCSTYNTSCSVEYQAEPNWNLRQRKSVCTYIHLLKSPPRFGAKGKHSWKLYNFKKTYLYIKSGDNPIGLLTSINPHTHTQEDATSVQTQEPRADWKWLYNRIIKKNSNSLFICKVLLFCSSGIFTWVFIKYCIQCLFLMKKSWLLDSWLLSFVLFFFFRCSLKFPASLAWPYFQRCCSLVQSDSSSPSQGFPDPSYV